MCDMCTANFSYKSGLNHHMRSLFKAEMGTPIESLFIETSTIPLRFVLKGRKIMYYWTLLRKSESELVKCVFLALQKFSTKNDWFQQVRAEMAACGINYSDEEISAMSKFKFKKIVDKKSKRECPISDMVPN